MFRVPMHSIVEAADCPAPEQLLLTVGRRGVLSSRAIATEELDTLLRLLGPPSERQRSSTAGSCSNSEIMSKIASTWDS